VGPTLSDKEIQAPIPAEADVQVAADDTLLRRQAKNA
jgi:hypothetical protein